MNTYRWNALGRPYVPPPMAPSHRSFGLTVGFVLIAFAAFTLWRGHLVRAEVLAATGAILVVAAIVTPSSLRGLAAIWSRIGHALGWFNSRVLLTLMFVVVMTPMGMVARLFGSDPLERRRRFSLWSTYPARFRDTRHYEKLY